MKVLFDYQAFGMQSHGGVSRGFVETICRLKPLGIDWEIAVKDSNNVYLSNLLPEVKLTDRYVTKYTFCNKYRFKGKGLLYDALKSLRIIHDSNLVNQKYSIEKIKEGDYDIFHPSFFDTYFLKYLSWIRNKPIVITIHDMIPEVYKDLYGTSLQVEQKKQLIKYASYVVVPSENTKNDVVRILKFPEEKIKVIHWGADILSEQYLAKLKPLVSYKYILFVGSRQKYKGFKVFLRQFMKVNQRHPNIHLICTGIPFNNEENKDIEKYNLKDKVFRIFVNQKDLHSLYKYAEAFVYPSLYEGFGIPIYEAFSCHCPVFLNDASCFREVGGDAAIYFNQDINDSNFSEIFEQYFLNKDLLRDDLIRKESKYIKANTWERVAKQYSDFYHSIV